MRNFNKKTEKIIADLTDFFLSEYRIPKIDNFLKNKIQEISLYLSEEEPDENNDEDLYISEDEFWNKTPIEDNLFDSLEESD